jgi:DNA (cytosine-5)-methyltransferase 1
MSLNVLDLFSGIGGFSLGLERAGMRTVAFCEIEPYPRAILRQHWPAVPCYDDVRTLTAERLVADGIGPIDVICGGFPCQDISSAGKGNGIDGERSGLWSEYARLVGEIRPRYVIVENVAALLGRGLDRVLGDLSTLGYDAEWHCIPASAVGAPHQRDRIWIVAYPARLGKREQDEERHPFADGGKARDVSLDGGAAMADAESQRRTEARGLQCGMPAQRLAGGSEAVSDATIERRGQGRPWGFTCEPPRLFHATRDMADANGESVEWPSIAWPQCDPWMPEPDVGRVVDGLPVTVVEQELRALGNAVVPQIPEIIGREIMKGLRR